MNFFNGKVALLALVVGAFPLQLVEASGSGGYGGGGNSFPQRSQPRPVDAAYERGKALFRGREKSYGDVRVCMSDSETGEAIKVKKKLLKPFKKGKALDFANTLHNCNVPEQKIVDVYARNDLAALVHYFNKRYKLKLQY
ncbi:hypothetical protein QSV34_08050 [Porticoccus sp. W117]|uniref:hypothetical protein n=1 Tax=Porticoccus sp. W117 TaxID=3054777 RepID=UPI0025944247|nr:hypothetical protein [Porticoccus sp. W117]MDM3871305.1 hypothetical protein [Porticoccus sp. W117]